MNVLYISYDGALDPLGRSQVIPYLEGLSRRGHSFDLITFEKPHQFRKVEDRKSIERRLLASNIRWHPLRYHKRFSALATGYDLARGFALGAVIQRTRSIRMIHARSYPAALVAWRLSRAFGIPFLFDMRGLYADERTDGGIWPVGGRLYQLTKRLEGAFLRDARAVVTLTQASVATVSRWISDAGAATTPRVIPTCVDTDRFQPNGKSAGLTVAYVGSIGTWYMLDEMLAFGRCMLDTYPDAMLRFITNGAQEEVRAQARIRGIDDRRFVVSSVPHEGVPAALADVAATFHFIRPTFSKIASAATKFAESLALGLPVVINPGIGDAAEIVRERRVGVIVKDFSPEAFRVAAEELRALVMDPGCQGRCRQAALDIFSLASGVDKYASLYDSMGID